MLHRRSIRGFVAGLALVGAALVTSSCSAKAREQFNDAPRGSVNKDAADIIAMPDGYSNLATKCDHGNRVYVAFKADANRAAVAVVANDPSCGNPAG